MVTIGDLMKLSPFNSFLAFSRKKAGMAGAGSKRILAFSLVLAALLLSIAAIFGATGRKQASAQSTGGVKASTEAIHILASEGTKSIAQLIREQSVGTPLPNQAIASFHFFVDPLNNSLIFSRVGPQNPTGFQWAILPGQDKKFAVPKTTVLAPQALEQYLVRTTGTTNFLLILEFYPLP
jgi:hypothetical protein